MKLTTALFALTVSTALFHGASSAEIRGSTISRRLGEKGKKGSSKSTKAPKGSKAPKGDSKKGKGKKGDPFKSTEKLRKEVSVKGILPHLTSFQRFSDFTPGSRNDGTEGFTLTGAYIAFMLEEAGYKITKTNFLIGESSNLGDSVLETADTTYTEEEDFLPMAFSPFGTVSNAVAQTVDNFGCSEADFDTFEAGNVAIIARGTCGFNLKVFNAQTAGAVGVVISNNEGAALESVTLGLEFPISIPVLFATYEVGLELGGVEITTMFSNTAIENVRDTFNIVADSSEGNEDQVALVGAFLGSVAQESPGIQVSGSGSATLLEVALQMALLDIKPSNKLRFGFWGDSLNGAGVSQYLVDLLNDSPDDLAKIALYLNFETIASPNFVAFVNDAEIDGDEGIQELFSQYFENFELPFEGRVASEDTDKFLFNLLGIPSGGLFTGRNGTKTEEQAEIFGGAAGEAYDPCFALECDDIDNVNFGVLDEMADAAAHAIQTFADMETLDLGGSGPARRSLGDATPSHGPHPPLPF